MPIPVQALIVHSPHSAAMDCCRRACYTENMEELRDLVNVSPEIMWGTPVIKGTRVPVKALFDYLAKGHSITEFLDDFPTVEESQALAIVSLAGSEFLTHIQSHENFAR